MLTMNRMTNSYKLYWFAAIFEEIKKGNQKITFRKIVLGMITKSWHTIIRYKLNLGWQDQLGELVHAINNKYDIEKNITEEDLMYFLEEDLKDYPIEARIKELTKYVPYRLLSPFYPELVGKKDYKKNDLIEELSKETKKAIYVIEDNKIIVNKAWFEYIYENQLIIEGWLKNKLIDFLQHRNPNVPAIPFKITTVQQRKLKRAKNYWKNILEIKQMKDVYSESLIDKEANISIDHFIPWRFVIHDKLWNLAPTFQSTI